MSISLAAPVEAHDSTRSRSSEHLPVSWVTVAVFAVALAYADGFWVTSALRAIGATANNQGPFLHWLRDSTLMLPPIVLAVLAALELTRRWVAQGRREIVQLAGAALLIIVISSAVSIAQVAISSASDYKFQASQLSLTHTNHFSTPAAIPVPASVTKPGACVDLCAARHSSMVVHVRAVGYATLVLLVTNVVLVIWLLAVRGGRLWAPHPRRSADVRTR